MSGMFNDFRLLLFLFIGMRIMLAMAYQPLLLDGDERGLTVGGDYSYYYNLAEQTEAGAYPYREWWSEFPPVMPFLWVGIYALLGDAVTFGGFAVVFGLLLLLCDVGNLVLMRAIGSRLHGQNTGMALAWVYALLAIPLVFTWWNFDIAVAFALLLGLWLLLRGQDNRAALVTAVGMLTKFVPALLIGAVIRYRKPAQAARFIAIVLAIFVTVYLLLIVTSPNPQMVTVSLTAQFGKASYQTVWALIDGNYGTGTFGSVASHFDLAAASELYGNPAVVPAWLRLAVAAAIGLWVFTRTRRFDDKGIVAFTTITLLIFFLQSQGWSPQWLTQIIPLVLLCFPNRVGVMIVIVLSALSFSEYPLLFIRTAQTDGQIAGALIAPFTVLVIARTVILVYLCVLLYGRLRQETVQLESQNER